MRLVVIRAGFKIKFFSGSKISGSGRPARCPALFENAIAKAKNASEHVWLLKKINKRF